MAVIGLFLQYSWILFVVAIIASIYSQTLFQKGDYAKGKKLLVVSFWCAAALAVVNGVIGLITLDGLTLFIAAAWAYFAWRDRKNLKQLGG